MLTIENRYKSQDIRLSLTQSQYNLGISFSRHKLWAEAIEAFRAALQIQPHFKIYVRLAEAFVALGNIQEAMESYRQAINLQPDQAELYSQLGNLLYEQQDWEAAQQAYQKALNLKPMFPEIQGNLGNIYVQQEQFDQALECYQNAVNLDPTLPDLYRNWGKLYLELNRLSEAVECYRQAVEIDPNSAKAHCGLGEVFIRLGEWEEAMACCRQALAIQPDFPEARRQLAVAMSEKEEWRWESDSLNSRERLESQLQVLTTQSWIVAPFKVGKQVKIEASFPMSEYQGFYRAEYGPDGKHFRWTNREFYFDLGIDRQQLIAFVLKVLPFNWEQAIDHMPGFDGDTELKLHREWENDIFYLKGILEPKPGVTSTRLSFVVPRSISEAENPEPSQQGIAFSELTLQCCSGVIS